MSFVTILAFAGVPTAAAQITSGTLSGTVKDPSGSPVGGATVVVTFPATGQKIPTRTKDDGRYLVANLRPGNGYIIQVTYMGFRPAAVQNVPIQLGATTVRNIVL